MFTGIFHKMATRLIFQHDSGATALVHVGFSWAAFFWGPLWAVAKRQWLLFILLCLAQIPSVVVSASAELRHDAGLFAFSMLLFVAYMIVCGAFANRWHRRFLERQGFAFRGTA